MPQDARCDAHRDQDAHSHPNKHADAHRHAQSDTDQQSFPNAIFHLHTYRDRDQDIHSHPKHNTDAYANQHPITNTDQHTRSRGPGAEQQRLRAVRGVEQPLHRG